MKRWIEFVLRYRRWVIGLTFVVTVGFVLQIDRLQLIVDPDEALPQTHPYIQVNNKVAELFGNKFTLVIGITRNGDSVFSKEFLSIVGRVSEQLSQAPSVVEGSVVSLAAPPIRRQADLLGYDVLARNPLYEGLLFSKNRETAQIVAEFKRPRAGFEEVYDAVHKIVSSEINAQTEINVGGVPVFLAMLERYSKRMAFLFPLAVLLVGLIHFEAFRTRQGLVLPLVTALLAVVWAVGILAISGQPLDVFNVSTPILILAIAAGHAVQILKRYYEEFHLLEKLNRSEGNNSKAELTQQEMERINFQAVERSLVKIGPVMIVACLVAAASFFSLMVFEIKSIRTFGLFTGAGVLSALVLELTFIPALRVALSAPKKNELLQERKESGWDLFLLKLYDVSQNKQKLLWSLVALIAFAASVGVFRLQVNNSQKSYFYGKITERNDDDLLNQRMSGTNTFYVLIDGGEVSKSVDKRAATGAAATVERVRQLQQFIKGEPYVGKVVSIVDLQETSSSLSRLPLPTPVLQQLKLELQKQRDPTTSVDGRFTLVQAFLKTDDTTYVSAFAERVQKKADELFTSPLKASVGGGVTGGVALNEVMVREKVLNILQIMGAVFVVSALVFRSVLAGIMILIPLCAAVLTNFGFMGLFGIPLQIATALVSAMAVGIGADYGIYMTYRIREELKQTPNDEAGALRRSFMSAGKAILFVSSAVAGGFGVLMLSWGFMVHLWMGFLIALAMVVSALTTLTVFPALLKQFRPRYIFRS